MYKLTQDSTEGVVVYDLIDPIRGSYVARARHRTIAAVVWERCGDILSKAALLLTAIKSLNLNYKTDADAFEQFIRSDLLVDSLRTLENRTLFFETAIQKDPQSPYVRQHYSRMLIRADKPELALSQIEKAIELDSRVLVLYHTQGLVLARLATAAESVELGRRRMVQAEQAYQRSLSLYDKDEYSYSSLARLYLDWAKKVPKESTDYIAKAEATISQGLRVVANKERLWGGVCRHTSMAGRRTESVEGSRTGDKRTARSRLPAISHSTGLSDHGRAAESYRQARTSFEGKSRANSAFVSSMPRLSRIWAGPTSSR